MAGNDGIGNVVSAARFGANPTVLGGAGLALGIASSMLGGKKGKKNPFIVGYRDGKYTMNGQVWDIANAYQVETDKGKYNFLSTAIGPNENGPVGQRSFDAVNKRIIDSFKGDQQAIDYYKNNFADPYTPIIKKDGPKVDFHTQQLLRGMGTYKEPPKSIAQQEADAAALKAMSPSERATQSILGSMQSGSNGYGRMTGLPPMFPAQYKPLIKTANYARTNSLESFTPKGGSADSGALATADIAKAKRYNSLLSRPASRTSTATTSSILAQAKG